MFQDINVLHVDDDPAIRDLTAEFLETVDDSISVRSEADPSTVPTRIDAEPIDCVVSDYRMPELDGLELCRRIRDDRPWFPFILFTSVRGEEVVEAAMDAGVTDYLRKETGTHHYTLLANRITLAVSRRRAVGRLQEAGALPPEWPPRTARADDVQD